MKGLTPYIKYGLSLLSMCLVFSCTEMSDEDLALDYESLTPTIEGEYVVIDSNFPEYIPQFTPVKNAPMIMKAGEIVRDIYFYGNKAADLNALIKSNKTSFPDDILVVHISTGIEVTTEPVYVYSNTIVSFESATAQIYAGEGVVADALISLPGTDADPVENVTIQCRETAVNVMLDGKGNSGVQGIRINKSIRVHMDNLIIADCGDGIGYTGINDTDLSHAGSVTRCEIYGCSNRGIVAYRNRGLVVANNYCHNNGHGIYLTITSATVHMNKCTDNTNCGLFVRGGSSATNHRPHTVVTRNETTGNDTGIGMDKESQYIFFTENVITGNNVGVNLAGTGNRVFDNTFDNADELTGSGCYVLLNKDLQASEVPSGVNYFNPPTEKNPHTDKVMITKERKDLVIDQDADNSITMSDVQSQLNAFKSANSSAYIVLTLNGTFVANGKETGLNVPSYTSVVLNGTMYAEGDGMRRYAHEDNYQKGDHTGGTQMVLFDAGNSYNSISGGTLDCTEMPAYGVYAPGKNLLILDDVNIIGAVDNQVSAIKHGDMNYPMIVHDCVFDGFGKTNRALWAHVCSFVYLIGCKASNHFADFVDIDAVGNDTYLLFNYTFNNKRDGVFIEEGASRNCILGNYFYGDSWGIGLYSTDPSGGLGYQTDNIYAFNRIEGSQGGYKLQHAKDNFSYNNIVLGAEYGVYSNCQGHYSCNEVFGTNFVWQTSTVANNQHIFYSVPN